MAEIIVPAEGRPTVSIDASDVLIGIDGNAFSIIGTTARVLRRNGAEPSFVAAFQKEATSGDYDHVIATAVAYLEADPS
jgi:hypothetical protein